METKATCSFKEYASYISVLRFRNLWDMNQQTEHCEYDIFIKASDVAQTSSQNYILFLHFRLSNHRQKYSS